jgi:putative transposase
MPFTILAAVVLPDHLHFLWPLPPEDSAYSQRIGKIKVLFTKSKPKKSEQENSISRIKHRESNIWQRRFWEHTIRDEEDLENYLN